MKNSKKITFEGFYGFKNTGDDAFVEVASWGSRKYWNCVNNVFLGADLPKVIHDINCRQILPKIKGMDRVNLLRHLASSNYFVSAGGSTFGEIPFHSNKALAQNFKRINKNLKSGGIGISVGPFKTVEEEKKVITYVKQLDFLAVRDNRSFEYLNSLNLPYTPINAFDLAALLPKIYGENKIPPNTKNTFTIGLSICNYERYYQGDLKNEQKRNAYFKELVELLAKDKSVHFKAFIINGNSVFGDTEATHELLRDVSESQHEILPYNPNTHQIWKEIAECDFMLSTRLHASIFACYAAVPFMLFEYHKKCADFLQDVGQAEKYRLYDAETPMDQTLKTINDIRNGYFIAPSRIEETTERSLLNFTQTIPYLEM